MTGLSLCLKGKGPHYFQITHTQVTLVLHNLPFWYPFAVTLLLVHGDICLLGFTAYSYISKFFGFFFSSLDHLCQLALTEVKMLAVVIYLKCFLYISRHSCF